MLQIQTVHITKELQNITIYSELYPQKRVNGGKADKITVQ